MRYLIVIIATGLLSFIAIRTVLPNDRRISGAGSDQLVFEKPFGNKGQILRLVRGPERPTSLLDLWKDAAPRDSSGRSAVQQIKNFFEIRLELITPDMPTLVLGSDLRYDLAGSDTDGPIEVLDCQVAPCDITVALAEGSSIRLWRVKFGASATVLSQMLYNWTAIQAPYVIVGSQTTATVGKTPDGRCQVVIHEGRSGTITVLEQPDLASLAINVVDRRTDKGK